MAISNVLVGLAQSQIIQVDTYDVVTPEEEREFTSRFKNLQFPHTEPTEEVFLEQKKNGNNC